MTLVAWGVGICVVLILLGWGVFLP
jgi:hypothetical protein